MDDDESDDEDEESKDMVTMFGQRWIRNPSSHLLPRLDSAPLLLSFEPNLEASARPEPNGNPAVHPTRNNPHPHSNELPETEERLLIVSAKHDLYHFEVLAGRLSEWSRKNPPSSYPPQFRTVHEPVKGCIWDVTEKSKRLWLYGEKWLFMFDLSKDFPISSAAEDQFSKKRKREAVTQTPRSKNNSGAGDAVPQSEAPVTKVRKFNSDKPDESSRSTWIDVASAQQEAESDEDIETNHQALANVRPSVVEGDTANAYMSSEEKEPSGDEKKRNQEAWWHSFKYRPILGVVPVGEDGQPLEVVLVERPSWDLDLPPRFVGSHE
jgi:U3 small nucleolar RNA-associated protein 4